MKILTACVAAAMALATLGGASAGEFGPKGGVVVFPTYPNPGPFPPRPFPHPHPGPVPPSAPVDFDYVVLYRPSPFAGWQVYGKFETAHGARAAEERLEHRGIAAKVERVRDRGYPRW